MGAGKDIAKDVVGAVPRCVHRQRLDACPVKIIVPYPDVARAALQLHAIIDTPRPQVIAIDVTIRFLVNYKQELPHLNYQVHTTLVQTIKHTGISIIYTSLVLVAGFIIFCFSDFGGTKALGWLTSITLVVSTLTNLVLLPALIKSFIKSK